MEKCALCLQESQLVKSHIIPNFIGKWLKSTSSGYFREWGNVNVVKQDLHKENLLCFGCEQLFSKWENNFCQRIFKPWHKDINCPYKLISKLSDLRNSKYLDFFVLSISWRVAYSKMENKLFLNDQVIYKAMLEEWRQALVNSKPLTNHSCHKAAGTPQLCNLYRQIIGDEALYSYILRGVDTKITITDMTVSFENQLKDERKIISVYTKLPGFCFISFYGFPPNKNQIPNTMINIFLKEPLEVSAKQIRNFTTNLSSKQYKKAINKGAADALSQNPSLAVKCLMADKKVDQSLIF